MPDPSPEQIEAGANALAGKFRKWDELNSITQAKFLHDARACLTAALSLEGEGEIARHEQLIDEANRSDLRAHDYANRLRRLGELADAMAAAIEAWQAGISPGANSFTEAEADLMGRVAEYREATTAEGWNGVIWPNAEVYFAILLDDNEVKAIYVNGKERPDLLNGSAGEENK